MKGPSHIKADILHCRPARAVVLSPFFPLAFQATALAAVLALAFAGFGVGREMAAAELMTLRKTNLSTLVVWGLWWPAMIVAALSLGRVWCTFCPMELVNRIGDAAARALGLRRAKLGTLLRAGWAIVVGYLVLQLLVAGLSIHRLPHYTSMLLFALLGAALLCGLIFREPRSFCRAFCPAGALLSVYGRYTPVQLAMRAPAFCDECPTKDCVRAENRYRFNKRSCPSLLQPFRRQPSDGCVLCLQCAKVCPYDNVGLGLASADASIRRPALLRPYEAAFVLVALGFVSHEVIGEVKWLDAHFHAVPTLLSGMFPSVAFNWLEAFWFLMLFPLTVWATIAAATYAAGHRSGIGRLLLAAATGAAPVIAVAHLAKAAAKIASWGGFLPLALTDPRGLSTLQQLSDGTLGPPPTFMSLTVIGWLVLAVMVLMGWKALGWSRQLSPDLRTAARIGMAGAAALFFSVMAVWGSS